jgi:hypothetical protein
MGTKLTIGIGMWIGAGACLLGCGDDPPANDYPYNLDETRVIGDDTLGANGGSFDNGTGSVGVSQTSTYATPDGDECINLDDVCLTPQDECGDDATADVIVGENGEVLDVLCYPNKEYDVIEIGDEPIEDPVLGNNQVIVFDGLDDGDDVVGDLTIEGNNAIVYGEGPDTSVIGGDLNIAKNNAIVRGVRIKGDVTLTQNNTSLVYCVIEGNLTIAHNNVSVALCDIHGTVTIEGNNTVFVSNRVAGDQGIEGDNLSCNDNFSFVDANEDFIVQDEELGDPITCISRDAEVPNDPNL